ANRAVLAGTSAAAPDADVAGAAARVPGNGIPSNGNIGSLDADRDAAVAVLSDLRRRARSRRASRTA
ncbi:MAG: hypothetical protein J2P25_05285, partial [Nocardiopsaceae bacterium]|nr:hypothetical protein [Nocardiopsaceae bacterium]